MSASYRRLSEGQVSPRLTIIFGMTRLLLVLLGLAGLGLFLFCAGSPSFSIRMFGESAGRSIGSVSGGTEAWVSLGILVGIVVMLYLSRTLMGRLLLLAGIAAGIAMVFVLPNPIGLVPATMLFIAIGGLAGLFLILCSVLTS